MEEYNFRRYMNTDLIEDYRKATEANRKACADFDRASAVFLKYQDSDSRKILEDVIDNILRSNSLKTKLAVCLADDIINPKSWRSHLDVDERRRKARAAAETIKRNEFEKKYGCKLGQCFLPDGSDVHYDVKLEA